jgi:phosphoribosylformylglycinamidine synthase subunit PurS
VSSQSRFRFAVNVPQGRAVEGSLGHLGVEGVTDVRVGRRVEMTVDASDEIEAAAVVDRLAAELLSNPLIEAYEVALIRTDAPLRTEGPVRTEVPAGEREGRG